VGVMRVREPDTVLHEVAKTAIAHVREESPRQITAQLIDGNL
jgi:hypothetical protein